MCRQKNNDDEDFVEDNVNKNKFISYMLDD